MVYQNNRVNTYLLFSFLLKNFSLGPNQNNAEKPRGLQFKTQNKLV